MPFGQSTSKDDHSRQSLAGGFHRRIKREHCVQSRYMKRVAHGAGGARQAHFAADLRDAGIGVDEAPDPRGIDVRDAAQVEDQILASAGDQLRNQSRQLGAFLDRAAASRSV